MIWKLTVSLLFLQVLRLVLRPRAHRPDPAADAERAEALEGREEEARHGRRVRGGRGGR